MKVWEGRRKGRGGRCGDDAPRQPTFPVGFRLIGRNKATPSRIMKHRGRTQQDGCCMYIIFRTKADGKRSFNVATIAIYYCYSECIS